MFTTGSKLFFGATALSLAGAVIHAVSTDGPTGVMGTVGLLTLAIVFGFLAGINYLNRDGNVPAMQQGAENTAAAAQPPVGGSLWPLITAVGVAGLVIGAVSQPVVFKVAVVVLLAATVEWMVQGWSERASADDEYNASIRKRILHPLEFPILGALGLGAVVYSFSRILLSLDVDSGKVVFILIGALILGGGFLFASSRKVTRRTVAGICALGAVALLGAGVASAVKGQRDIPAHPTTAGSALCLEPGTEGEIDDHSSQDVSAKSNVIANIYLQADGELVAFINGYENIEYHEITVPRNAQVGLIFHNESADPQRLTARLGTFGENPEVVECTTAANPGKQTYLDFKIPKTNAASPASPLELMVPGVPGAVIAVVVP